MTERPAFALHHPPGMPKDPADAVFGALAEPVRRRLLHSLAEHPATATELAGQLPISRQAVTKHLTSLTEAGLLVRERSGRDVRYRFEPQPLTEAMSWMATVGGQWDQRLARLQATLEARTVPGSTRAADQRGEMPR